MCKPTCAKNVRKSCVREPTFERIAKDFNADRLEALAQRVRGNKSEIGYRLIQTLDSLQVQIHRGKKKTLKSVVRSTTTDPTTTNYISSPLPVSLP